jgi:hypothetical protein
MLRRMFAGIFIRLSKFNMKYFFVKRSVDSSHGSCIYLVIRCGLPPATPDEPCFDRGLPSISRFTSRADPDARYRINAHFFPPDSPRQTRPPRPVIPGASDLRLGQTPTRAPVPHKRGGGFFWGSGGFTSRADPCKTGLIEAARRATGIQQHAQRFACRIGSLRWLGTSCRLDQGSLGQTPAKLGSPRRFAALPQPQHAQRALSGESLAHEPGAATPNGSPWLCGLADPDLRVGWIRAH